MSYVVTKRTAPLGFSFKTFLSHPRAANVESWDEEHDALVFGTWWAAAWQALRHFPATVEKRSGAQ